MDTSHSVNDAVQVVLAKRAQLASQRSLLAGISGIDGAGKGYVAAQVVAELQCRKVNAAVINVDGWLNLPQVRFNAHDPARHFYRHALRLDAMFEQLILPLKRIRSHRVEADFAEETAAQYRKHIFEYTDIDVIVLEGIYLFKRAYRHYFDLACWVDCSFETALQRAIARAQEGLPPEETRRAYESIYFPAQRIHFAEDDPRGSADLVIANDMNIY